MVNFTAFEAMTRWLPDCRASAAQMLTALFGGRGLTTPAHKVLPIVPQVPEDHKLSWDPALQHQKLRGPPRPPRVITYPPRRLEKKATAGAGRPNRETKLVELNWQGLNGIRKHQPPTTAKTTRAALEQKAKEAKQEATEAKKKAGQAPTHLPTVTRAPRAMQARETPVPVPVRVPAKQPRSAAKDLGVIGMPGAFPDESDWDWQR